MKCGPVQAVPWFVALMLAATGCAPSDRAPEQAEPGPTLADLRPRVQPPQETARSSAAPRFVLSVVRLNLPLDEAIDEAWALGQSDALPPAVVDAWRVNGLNVTVLDESQLERFGALLPAALGTGRQTMILGSDPVPLRVSPSLTSPRLVDLTLPPRTPKVIVIRGGRCQLLVQVERDEAGRTFIELTPHHHVVRTTLQPRTPQEKALDGRIFDELALRAPVAPGKLLAISLYRSAPPPPPEPLDLDDVPSQTDDAVTHQAPPPPPASLPASSAASASPQAPAAGPQAAPSPGPTPLFNNIGQQLLTGRRGGSVVQIILLVRLVEPSIE